MTAIQYAYLGKAGAMRQLPIPRRAFEAGAARGEATFGLASGGTAVVRLLNPKHRFTLPYDVTAAEADVILGFYQGLFGTGPWRFVDPSARNMLGLDVSSCGLRAAAPHGWIQSTGTLTRSTGGPAGVNSGVLTWNSLAASATLQPGTVANTADITSAPVYVAAEAVTASVYVLATTATTASLQLTGYNASGVVNVSTYATSMAVTTSWQRFTVTAGIGAAAFASAVYVLPRIVLGGSVPAGLAIAGAQLEYGDTVTAWQPGFGVPQVVITDPPGRTFPAPGWRGHTLALAEV